MRVSIVDFLKVGPKDLAAVVSVGMPVHTSIRISAHAHSLDEHDMDAPMPTSFIISFYYLFIILFYILYSYGLCSYDSTAMSTTLPASCRRACECAQAHAQARTRMHVCARELRARARDARVPQHHRALQLSQVRRQQQPRFRPSGRSAWSPCSPPGLQTGSSRSSSPCWDRRPADSGRSA